MYARHFDQHQVLSVFQTFSTMQTKRSGKMRAQARHHKHTKTHTNIRNGTFGGTCYQYNLNMRMCKSSSISINRLIVHKRHPSTLALAHIFTSNSSFLTASKINVFVCCIVACRHLRYCKAFRISSKNSNIGRE